MTRNGTAEKKEPPFPAAQRFNREASNRVDRSHSMSKSKDNMTNDRESLTIYEDI
jgi:hypothetical protein